MNNHGNEKTILIIQEQYKDWTKNGKWRCPDGHVFESHNNVFVNTCWCKVCKKKTYDFIPANGKNFESEEFDIIFKKYCDSARNFFRNKIISGLDFDLFMSLLSERFLNSVMSYDATRNARFHTYWFKNIYQARGVFEISSSRAKSNPNIKCQLCGYDVANITRFHLKKKNSCKDGYPGHSILHDHMEKEDIHITDIVKTYSAMFPDAEMSGTTQILRDDYNSFCHRRKVNFAQSRGKFLNVKKNRIFVQEHFGAEETDAVVELAEKISCKLHSENVNDEERIKRCKNSQTEKELRTLLEKILPFMALQYNLTEIAKITKYPLHECSFWSKKIKSIELIK